MPLDQVSATSHMGLIWRLKNAIELLKAETITARTSSDTAPKRILWLNILLVLPARLRHYAQVDLQGEHVSLQNWWSPLLASCSPARLNTPASRRTCTIHRALMVRGGATLSREAPPQHRGLRSITRPNVAPRS
jgi:hypothetical protein